MKEELYTIPVNDAFAADCECPLCAMRKELEQNAIEYTMGPSYMEDDNRALTDEQGFCMVHIKTLYEQNNRLGLALMLQTHMMKTTKDLKALSTKKPAGSGLLKKDKTTTPVWTYIQKKEENCFICNRVNHTFERYLHTIFHLWKKDKDFSSKFKSCKGFCTYHYGLLFETSKEYLKGAELDSFLNLLNEVYFENMSRLAEDIEWFINKFDYRYQDEPWKNAKDALPRSIVKTNHTILDR
ncbi:MAG: hypothetical protein IJA32_11860 [Lachnospiraceae bacterium]|nr:hypothetical protein [Lachnospiraceae bacterium]